MALSKTTELAKRNIIRLNFMFQVFVVTQEIYFGQTSKCVFIRLRNSIFKYTMNRSSGAIDVSENNGEY